MEMSAVDWFAMVTSEIGYVSQDQLKEAKLMEERQSNQKIDKAIIEFERLKKEAKSLKDVVYLDGVLSVLDSIKNDKI